MATPPLGREGATDASNYQYEIIHNKVNENEKSIVPEAKRMKVEQSKELGDEPLPGPARSSAAPLPIGSDVARVQAVPSTLGRGEPSGAEAAGPLATHVEVKKKTNLRFAFLHLFAGPPKKLGWGQAIQKEASRRGCTVEVENWDILSDGSDTLVEDNQRGYWNVS